MNMVEVQHSGDQPFDWHLCNGIFFAVGLDEGDNLADDVDICLIEHEE